MGKISSEPRDAETRATHFSHPHPLTLICHNPNPNLADYSSCSGCKLKPSAGAIIYSCTTCNFFLHKACFEMPQKITHPFHKDHALDLLPAPAYAEGVYSCDACQEAGTGFSYHCKPCGVDLHILCAAAPLSLTSACHAHKLQLQFESPYVEKSFSCDVCRGHGSNHWLYRCNLCGFDAHLKCARAAPPVVNPVSHANFMGFQSVAAAPAPVFVAAPAAAAPYPMMNNAAVGVPAVSRQSGQLSQFQTIMQSIHNNHAAMAGRIGGGGGGAGLQRLTPFISGLNNITGFGGGGGGGIPGLNAFGGGVGGGIPGLNAFGGGGGGGIPGFNAFGGGGGGQDFLQALMNGGGGLDSLQSLLGGGGGGGGPDSLQSLLGDSGGLDFLGGVGDLL